MQGTFHLPRNAPPSRSGPRAWTVGLDRTIARPSTGALIAAIVFLGSFLGPSVFVLKVGVVFTAVRAALFALLLPSLAKILKKIGRGRYVPVLSDLFVVAMTIWMELALAVTAGIGGLTSAYAIRPIEFLSAYFVGRCFFADREGLRRFMDVLLVVVMIMLVVGLLDDVVGKNIFGGIFRAPSSDPTAPADATMYRFGLPRVRGPLEHAITFGLYFSVCATLIFYLGGSPVRKLFGLCVCLGGVMIALSSAPMLSFMIFVSFVLYDQLLSASRWRWQALIGLVLYGLAGVLVFCEHPLEQLIKIFTLDPSTGLYRILIWEWAAYNLQTSPLFGIGNADWVRLSIMTDSIDALWLNQVLQSGYGGLVLLIASIAGSFVVLSPRKKRSIDNPFESRARRAITIAMIQMIFVAFTVHYWGSSWALFALLIGIRAGLSEACYLPELPQLVRPASQRTTRALHFAPRRGDPLGLRGVPST